MIKVACISCENPYELDERRLPPSGLRMKCPKCGTAFLVFPDARTAPAPALPPKPIAPPLPKPAIPKPPPPQRGPTIGLDEMDPQDLPTLARPAGAELDLPAPRPARPAAPAAPRGLLGEDLDLPARRPAPREQPESG
ncbi:MAG: zinc-ribbon domain-containing protein, partial [Deltaproteobacteria bacterium]